MEPRITSLSEIYTTKSTQAIGIKGGSSEIIHKKHTATKFNNSKRRHGTKTDEALTAAHNTDDDAKHISSDTIHSDSRASSTERVRRPIEKQPTSSINSHNDTLNKKRYRTNTEDEAPTAAHNTDDDAQHISSDTTHSDSRVRRIKTVRWNPEILTTSIISSHNDTLHKKRYRTNTEV